MVFVPFLFWVGRERKSLHSVPISSEVLLIWDP